ncbi:double-stranded RNA-binding protein 3-like isoform X1 [Pistacia vera]|uniref:double-stranded RNA-binding protein 3-like isoform X1 n=2 Tax=Pistacia vera TaxID=55513 RepID=UPI001262F32E|nr:double-stranded RNA-binding protein 3-like isoform X1 [Pistacia vera]
MADMFKNQLQELAQRSCFNLPSYACVREGPDHAPRFKASVNFNGEIFESPSYCTTLRQAEHAAAEVALNVLSTRGPSRSLTARILDETGIYKNLLQETAHRAGLNLPVYTTVRSGPGHVPIFTCTVELAGMNFTGEPAKTKKQAEKNAAIAAWSALKRMPNLDSLTNKDLEIREEQDQAIVARVLSSFRTKYENRNARRRDQNQARRRMFRGPRENVASSSTSSLLHQQWRLLDLLMDSSGLDGSTSTQKQNSFVSLLPPPPPRSTSKILPPTSHTLAYPSNRPIPQQVKGNSIMEEHQRNEEEWLGGKQDIIKKHIDKEGSSNSNSSHVYGTSSLYKRFRQPSTSKFNSSMLNNTTHINNNRLFGSLNPSPITTSTPIRTPLASHMTRSMYTGGFNPHRIAPAVQIRSVIPVCAAPPPMRTPSTNQPSMKEASTSSSTSSVPSQTGGTEVSSAGSSSVFNNPTQQLGSEFNKLQL